MASFTVRIALLALLTSRPISAAAGPSLTNAEIRGRALIADAVAEAGGEARLRAVTTLHYVLEGQGFNGLQGFDPADVDTAKPIGSVSLAVDADYANHRVRRRNLQVLPGGIHLEAVTTFKDGEATTAYPGGGHMSRSAASEASATGLLDRYSPAFFLRRALDNLTTATFLGRRVEAGEPVDVVELSWDPATRVRARLSARSGRLLSIEAVGRNPLTGDAGLTYRFKGEQRVDGLALPREVKIDLAGRPYLAFRVTEAAVNGDLAPALFDAPQLTLLDTEVATHALGGGAYEITGLDGGAFRVVFFDLGDGVAVFDAPISRARSEWVMSEIARTLGDKPIRYLVVSHFHDDHVAGIGAYVDRGVQIVTTRANAPVLARYAVAQSRLNPDRPPLGRAPAFLFVDGPRLDLAGPEGRMLSLYRLADCPHAKDMLAAYLPSERLLVQADLFVDLAGFSPASSALDRWLASPSAPPVDGIVGTHSARISRAAFEAAAQAARL